MNRDELEAGREMDGLVAERVMGWERFVSADHTQSTVPYLRSLGVVYGWRRAGVYIGLDVPRFSTDIAAAWLVAARMRERFDCTVEVEIVSSIWERGGRRYVCALRGGSLSYDTPNLTLSIADTTPAAAICRAALKAVAP